LALLLFPIVRCWWSWFSYYIIIYLLILDCKTLAAPITSNAPKSSGGNVACRPAKKLVGCSGWRRYCGRMSSAWRPGLRHRRCRTLVSVRWTLAQVLGGGRARCESVVSICQSKMVLLIYIEYIIGRLNPRRNPLLVWINGNPLSRCGFTRHKFVSLT
jgi:hypothetical protein